MTSSPKTDRVKASPLWRKSVRRVPSSAEAATMASKISNVEGSSTGLFALRPRRFNRVARVEASASSSGSPQPSPSSLSGQTSATEPEAAMAALARGLERGTRLCLPKRYAR